MPYSFYVTDHPGNRVPVHVRPATEADFQATVIDRWGSDWTSEFIQNPAFEKFAFVSRSTGRLIALGAYEDRKGWYSIQICFAETEPKSHPRLVAKREERRYTNVGKTIIAYGVLLSIQSGYDGTVHFKAKTTELYQHYKKDFGALDLPYEPYALILFGEQAMMLLNEFKEDAS